jgi:hypothetical protein
MRLFSFYSENNQPYMYVSDHLWMFSFISKKFSDKKFCTWDIISRICTSSDLIYGCFRSLAKNFPIKNFALGIYSVE